MIGLVITCIIAVSAIVVIPNLSYVNLLYVDQQQLRNIALDTLKTMLLDAGYPASWGTTDDFDPDDVERFGLALAGSSSFYVLDPDKVQRLVAGNPAGVIEYEDIRTELKLQGYGFNFRIIPPFKVIVNDIDFDGESNPITLGNLTEGVEVFITYNAGSPIPKASVETTLFYVLDKENFNTTKASNSTDALGNCIINLSDFNPEIQNPYDITDFIIVFKVTVADVTTITSSYMEGFEQQHVMNASIVGENITLAIPEGPGWEKGSAGARWVDNVVVVSADGIWNIYNGSRSNEDKITWGGAYWGWSRLFSGLSYYNPLFIIINLSVPEPRRLVLFLGPDPNWAGSRVEAYGDPTGSGGASSAVKVQRDVVISGMTYIAELTLWKESP